MQVAQSLQIPAGYYLIKTEPTQLKVKLTQGYTLLAHNTDVLVLDAMCRCGMGWIIANILATNEDEAFHL